MNTSAKKLFISYSESATIYGDEDNYTGQLSINDFLKVLFSLPCRFPN